MIDTFMFCDVRQYELSARGEMTGDDVLPLVAAIEMLPDECVVVIELRDLVEIDAAAVTLLRRAVDERAALGVEFVIEVGSSEISEVLVDGGLGHLLAASGLRHAS